jgi:hypothetical protein
VKFAYADPPYFNQGKKRYGEFHPEAAIWDKQEAHIDLINKLVEEYPDGWALSCNPRDLQWLLPHCPETVRVCSWVKTFHQIRPTTVQFAWEPVLLGGGRKNHKRKPMVRDWLSCAVTRKKGLPGAKPDAFNDWILLLLNYEKGDQLDDLFPGTNGMASAIERINSLCLPL